MFHEHLQADVISEHGRTRRVLAPGEHIVVGLGRVHLGQKETGLQAIASTGQRHHNRKDGGRTGFQAWTDFNIAGGCRCVLHHKRSV